MKYKKIDMGSYNLHLLKTNKFKTINVRVNFRRKIKKEEVTIRNILTDLMTHSSKKYKTKKELVIKTQDLYAVNLTAGTNRIGDFINTSFTLSCLNDKYTEPDNFSESLKFFHEVLFEPNVVDGEFNHDAFDIIYENAKTSLVSMRENSSYYSLIRCLENMDPNACFSIRMVGYLEDLDNINYKNTYLYYKDMIKKDLIDIFVIGDFKIKEMENLIKKTFTFNTYKKKENINIFCNNKKVIRKKTIKEDDDTKQSKLVIASRIGRLTTFERNYALTLYSLILGGGADSKLFTEVREKSSLAYYINAVPNKLDSTLIIRAGISKDNFTKTVKLIEKEISNMKKGNFLESDIEKAIKIYNNSLDEIYESPSYLMEAYYLMSLVDIDDLDMRRKKIKEVTKEDIVGVAKKIKVDTVYLLEGGDQ